MLKKRYSGRTIERETTLCNRAAGIVCRSHAGDFGGIHFSCGEKGYGVLVHTVETTPAGISTIVTIATRLFEHA
jgi:hypothetical protein